MESSFNLGDDRAELWQKSRVLDAPRATHQVTAKAGGLELDKLSVSTEVTKKVLCTVHFG